MKNKIKNMTVAKKLRYCITIAIVLASCASIIGVFALIFVNSSYSSVLVSNGFSQGEIGIFSTYLNKEPAMVREMILLEDEDKIKEAVEELDGIKEKTDAALDTMEQHCTTSAEMEFVNTINETLPKYREIFSQVQELAVKNQNQDALNLLLSQENLL